MKKHNYKDVLIGLGTLAAIVSPIAAVVSCSADSEESNNEQQNHNEGIAKELESMQVESADDSQLVQIDDGTGITPAQASLGLDHLQYRSLASAGITREAYWGLETYSQEFRTKLAEFRSLRKGEWAPIGDTVIDNVNDYRFATLEASKGNIVPVTKLKEVINTVPFLRDQLTADTSTLEPGKALAINSMNAFLNSGDISTTTGVGAGLDGQYHGEVHSRINPYTQDGSEKDVSNMKPLLPSASAMGWAQYRTQQFEWRGEWDGHAYDRTNLEIDSGTPATNGGQEFISHAPQTWDHAMGENLGMIGRIRQGSGNDGHFSTITPEEAFSATFGLFLDRDDATGTIGHRGNILTSTYQTMGWSVSINKGPGENAYEQSMIMEFGGAPSETPPLLTGISFANDSGDFTQFVLHKLQTSTLPDGFKTMSRTEKVEAINSNLDTIMIDDTWSLKAYSLSATALPVGTYDGITNQVIRLSGKDSTTQSTAIYNVLGSGTQALFEDNAFDDWQRN